MANDRKGLLESLASLTDDFASTRITPRHIDRWVQQFDGPDGLQETILAELTHVLQSTYLSRARMERLIRRVASYLPAHYGETPESFWSSVAIVFRTHWTSKSHSLLLEKLNSVLGRPLTVIANSERTPSNRYVFLDDVLYTGDQVDDYIGNWLQHAAPAGSHLDIVVLAAHTAGKESSIQKLGERVRYKSATFHVHELSLFENRPSLSTTSQVLWPVAQPRGESCAWYADRLSAEGEPLQFRVPTSAPSPPFSHEKTRRILEDQFAEKGARLIRLAKNPYKVMRPLGYSRVCGYGFGSLVLTYRRGANNLPLVLWYGDPGMGYPLNQWYPLFPRNPLD